MSDYDYFRLRDALATDLRRDRVSADPVDMVAHVVSCGGVGRDAAAEIVERFLRDVRREVVRHRELAPRASRRTP